MSFGFRAALAVIIGVCSVTSGVNAQNSLSNALGGEKIYSGMQKSDVEAIFTSTAGVEVLDRMSVNEDGVTASIWAITANEFPVVVSLFCEDTMPACYFMNFFTLLDVPAPTLSTINTLNTETFVPFGLAVTSGDGSFALRGNMMLEGVTARAITSHLELMPAVFVAFAQALGVATNSVSTDLGSDGASSEPFDLAALQVMRKGALSGEAARLMKLAKADISTMRVFEDAHTRATLMKVLNQPGQ